ncbi:hypothetical protein ATCV1_Z702R [Acanthocystis turfacea chlorella virus 1]|uniref:Uncharacterized protein Z702R n=1 Tax=Chlorovirus heliozoae TaxID=322019 RepID=A7K9W2_9PHYC|nr:hypothetical protein ATCV1_Z702R [Acanthocystis turfacea chlorella virus 1]ABT16836.1 hypothetical protein ATCV1_Z702R [Acanthocystis turfacea chlorella virus 1]
MIVNGFSKYTFENNSVFVARGYPLAPMKGKYPRFFMVDDNGDAHVMSIKNIRALLKDEPKTPPSTPDSSPEDGPLKRSRSKRVLHRSTGTVYGSMKAATEALGITANKLKSSDDFIIS